MHIAWRNLIFTGLALSVLSVRPAFAGEENVAGGAVTPDVLIGCWEVTPMGDPQAADDQKQVHRTRCFGTDGKYVASVKICDKKPDGKEGPCDKKVTEKLAFRWEGKDLNLEDHSDDQIIWVRCTPSLKGRDRLVFTGCYASNEEWTRRASAD